MSEKQTEEELDDLGEDKNELTDTMTGYLLRAQALAIRQHLMSQNYETFVEKYKKTCDDSLELYDKLNEYGKSKVNDLTADIDKIIRDIKWQHQARWLEEQEVIKFLTKYKDRGVKMAQMKKVNMEEYGKLKEQSDKFYAERLHIFNRFVENPINFDDAGNLCNKKIAELMDCIQRLSVGQ